MTALSAAIRSTVDCRQSDVRLYDLVDRLWILAAERQVDDQELGLSNAQRPYCSTIARVDAIFFRAIDLEHQRVGGPVHRVDVPAGDVAAPGRSAGD